MFNEISQLITLVGKYGKLLPFILKLVQDIENEVSSVTIENSNAIAVDVLAAIQQEYPNFPTGDVADIEADIVKLFQDIAAKKTAAIPPANTAQ